MNSENNPLRVSHLAKNEDLKKQHQGGELIAVTLKAGERLYACNYKTGSLVNVNDEMIQIPAGIKGGGKKWFIVSKPDTFYFNAKNMTNAQFKLKGIIEQYGAKSTEP